MIFTPNPHPLPTHTPTPNPQPLPTHTPTPTPPSPVNLVGHSLVKTPLPYVLGGKIFGNFQSAELEV